MRKLIGVNYPDWSNPVIYLLDCDGDLTWCADPDPGSEQKSEDAIEYVRSDIYKEAIAELETLRATHKELMEQEPALRLNSMGGGMQWNPSYKGDWSGEFYAKPIPVQLPKEITASDYEEVIADHKRLVRELDVLLNGDGAAKQASLCDVVGQVAQLVREKGSPLLRSSTAVAVHKDE